MPIISIIAGARPNFMKVSPIIKAIVKARETGAGLDYRLIHTGQHFDRNMSQAFFEDLGIPEPDVNLDCCGGSQAEQTAAIMIAFEREIRDNPTDLVLVVGDVTSTMACSIVAKKEGVRVAHVEAGIRSFDLSMPEEINRMVTDSLCDYFFTTSVTANENLRNIGASDEQIHFVGNVMIDTLMANRSRFRMPECWNDLGLRDKRYFVLTMHRPANVDEAEKLAAFMNAISDAAGDWPVVFPIHPRTRNIFERHGVSIAGLHTVEPLGYLEFNYLVERSAAVITDSGGITEETTVMGVPCLTLRDNTERPETITVGTNELVGTDPEKIPLAIEKVKNGTWKKGGIPDLWDGHTSERIVKILTEIL
jgi:UDP-N-acetylglucosamine 2-epimerase (non-hydrolysing)